MEHRSKKATIRILILVVGSALPTVLWGQQLQFDVRHERALKDHSGRVTIDERGVEYQQALTAKQQVKAAKGKKTPSLESVRWDYPDIQELWISPHKLVLVTYKDRKWFLGVDKEFEFLLTGEGQTYETAYELLRGKLDQRFVAALADPKVEAAWEMPVKLLGTLHGSEGVLQVGADRIVYKTARKDHSRTWRLGDIENVSTSGPFQLTLTTFERAKMHYGSMKGFNFQLKKKLDEKQFDLLWQRISRDKGLQFLTSIEERNQSAQ